MITATVTLTIDSQRVLDLIIAATPNQLLPKNGRVAQLILQANSGQAALVSKADVNANIAANDLGFILNSAVAHQFEVVLGPFQQNQIALGEVCLKGIAGAETVRVTAITI